MTRFRIDVHYVPLRHTTPNTSLDPPDNPTELTLKDLWTNPKKAANFLALDGEV